MRRSNIAVSVFNSASADTTRSDRAIIWRSSARIISSSWVSSPAASLIGPTYGSIRLGLTGLVFKTTDSLGLHARLDHAGIPVENPAEFSRPVGLADGLHDASFRVVRLGSQLFPNGRVFFCHHFTPELVWRDEWRQHPNGVTDIAEFFIAAGNPQTSSELYREIFGHHAVSEAVGGFSLQAGKAMVFILTPEEIGRRFAGAAPVSENGSDRMVALTFRTRALATVERLLAANDVSFLREGDRIVVPHNQAEGVALSFVEN